MSSSPSTPLIRPGLCSVSFRALSPEAVIRAVADAGLEGIEWGGDVHVPPGDLANTRRVGERTREAGLTVAAYGSYYRLGAEGMPPFAAIVETAKALHAPVIRVWAGTKGSAETDTATRERIIADARAAAQQASDAGLRVACEWHGGTLTDTLASGFALLDTVDHPAFGTYWQPRTRQPVTAYAEELPAVLPRLFGLHVFSWDAETGARLPLDAGRANWPGWLATAQTAPAAPFWALLEFLRQDDPANLPADAATLRDWLQTLPNLAGAG